MRLNKRTVDALACPPGRKDALFFDAELKGFGLRVTAGGAKVFIFQYGSGSQRRRMRIGEYGTLTPDQARRRAEELRGQVVGGADPKAERAAARRAAIEAAAAAKRQSAADAVTFKVLVERWRDLHLVNRRPGYRAEAVRALLATFPAWKDRPAHGIAAAEVIAELDRVTTTSGPSAARLALAYGRAMFGWACKRRLLAVNPFDRLPAPAAVVDRDRVLSDAELAAIWTASGELGWPFGPLVRVLLLTLQRREEVAGMAWAELAADLSTWTLPAERAKNGRAHIVHLAPEVRAIIRDLPRQEGVALVFTTTGETPVSAFSRAKARLVGKIHDARKNAGAKPLALPDWRLHDFRRTGVTRLAALGFPPHVCDRLLNHVQGSIRGVAAVYQRHDFAAERETALQAWARHVVALGDGRDAAAEAAKVLPLHARRRVRHGDAPPGG